MWIFKQVGNEYHVGYLVNEQRTDNGRVESRFMTQLRGLDEAGAMRTVHYLNGGESVAIESVLDEEMVEIAQERLRS